MTVDARISQLEHSLAYPTGKFMCRTSEVLMYEGKCTIQGSSGLSLWQGRMAVTRDGIYYRVRLSGGIKLEAAYPTAHAVLKGGGHKLWWTDKGFMYFGEVWNPEVTEELSRMGWRGALLVDRAEAEKSRTTGAKVVSHATTMGSTQHQLNPVMVQVADLPAGIELNAKTGKAQWGKGHPRYGQFVGKDTIEAMRKEQGMAVIPAQKVEATKVASKAAQVVARSTDKDYEDGFTVGYADRERNFVETFMPGASDSWVDGYEEGYSRKPAVDNELLSLKSDIANTQGILAELMARLTAKLG